MPFAAAGAIAGVASAGIGLAGSMAQSGAVASGKKEANAALSAAAGQQRNDLMPWATSGGLASTASTDLLGLNGPDAATAAMGNYQTSPGYQWQLSQGLRGVDAGAAAKGMLRSGATLKAEQTFGAGLADSDFQQYYKNLMGLSTLGESAASKQGAGSLEAAKAMSGVDTGAAGAQASIYGNAAKGLSTGVNDLFGPSGAFSGGGSGTGVVDTGSWQT